MAKIPLLLLCFFLALHGALAGGGAVNWLVLYDSMGPRGAVIARNYQNEHSILDSHLFACDFPKLAGDGFTVAQAMNSEETYAFIEELFHLKKGWRLPFWHCACRSRNSLPASWIWICRSRMHPAAHFSVKFAR